MRSFECIGTIALSSASQALRHERHIFSVAQTSLRRRPSDVAGDLYDLSTMSRSGLVTDGPQMKARGVVKERVESERGECGRRTGDV